MTFTKVTRFPNTPLRSARVTCPDGFQLFEGSALADRANRHMDEWLRNQIEA
jgi:hypothetical protein